MNSRPYHLKRERMVGHVPTMPCNPILCVVCKRAPPFQRIESSKLLPSILERLALSHRSLLQAFRFRCRLRTHQHPSRHQGTVEKSTNYCFLATTLLKEENIESKGDGVG